MITKSPDTKLPISRELLNVIICFNNHHKLLFNALLSVINRTWGNKVPWRYKVLNVCTWHWSFVIERQWVSLVITLGGCSRRTQWSSLLDWTTTYTTFTVAVLLLVHDHMFLQNVLQPHDLIMWLGFLSSPAIYISTPLYALRFWTKCLNAWETFSCSGLS